MHYTSRSAIERFERCPRARFYENHLGGIGISPNKINLDIEIGNGVHAGLAAMLGAIMEGSYEEQLPHTFDDVSDRLILATMNDFIIKLDGMGAYASEDDIWKYQVEEATAMVEAMLRMWSIVVLPKFIERFKVLAVEREDTYPLGEGITLGARIDSIVQSRTNAEEIKLTSWKTTKKYDERTEKAASHDNQGISETIVAEYQMHKDNSAIESFVIGMEEAIRRGVTEFKESALPNGVEVETREFVKGLRSKQWPNVQVSAVIMGYFLKGEKNLDSKSDDSRYIFGSPLIRGYRKWNGEEYEYAWQYNPPSDTTKSGKSRLGKGWERFDAWSEVEGGIKAWINMLAEETDEGTPVIQPECGWCLPQQYIEQEFYRNDREMESWIRQKRAIEQKVQRGLAVLGASETEDEIEMVLDKYFPQTRGSCHYPSDCPYIPACFDSEVHADPMNATDKYGDTLYSIRVPHHEPERKALEEAKEEAEICTVEDVSPDQGEE